VSQLSRPDGELLDEEPAGRYRRKEDPRVSPPGFRAVPIPWFWPWGKETASDGTTEEVFR